MLDIPATHRKLAEAQFFYGKLSDVGRKVIVQQPETFGFYLSAFASAGRSVTFALQKEQKERYDAWFSGWGESLTDHQRDVMEFFRDQRVASIHLSGIDLAQGVETISHYEYMAAAAREGAKITVYTMPGTPPPEFLRIVRTVDVKGSRTEVLAVAEEYLGLLTNLVADFKARYANES